MRKKSGHPIPRKRMILLKSALAISFIASIATSTIASEARNCSYISDWKVSRRAKSAVLLNGDAQSSGYMIVAKEGRVRILYKERSEHKRAPLREARLGAPSSVILPAMTFIRVEHEGRVLAAGSLRRCGGVR
jgi:hypothetical protein